jgi:gluconolactonase
MKNIFLALAALLLATSGAKLAQGQTPVAKPIIKLDPALDSIVASDAKLEVIKRGFGMTEGQTWVQHGKDGYLLFTDIPANVINKMTPDGEVSVLLNHAGYTGSITGIEMLTIGSVKTNGRDPNDPLFRKDVFVNIGADGLTLDREGRVIVCTYAGRSLIRIEKDGKRTLLADRYQGKQFNGTNDVVVKKDGAIYFTDTLGGLRDGDKDPLKGVDKQGVYMIKDGKLSMVVDDMPTVNGLAFSPDEKYLYVNSGNSNQIRRYDVRPDDTVANGRLLIDLSVDKTWGYTDGMRVDSKGNIYPTGPGGIWIVSPEGKHLGTILTPEKVANLSFGDPDFKTLYLGGMTSIYKIRVLTPSLPCNSCSSQ